MLHHYDKESRLNSFTSAGEESRLDINLKDIGHHLTPPRHEYGPAVRDYWLIHVVASGRGRFIKNGIETELGAEDCFIIRPMEVNTIGWDSAELPPKSLRSSLYRRICLRHMRERRLCRL